MSSICFPWTLANKAAYEGAHTAIISNPVAAGITNLNNSYEQTQIGEMCFSTGVTLSYCFSQLHLGQCDV